MEKIQNKLLLNYINGSGVIIGSFLIDRKKFKARYIRKLYYDTYQKEMPKSVSYSVSETQVITQCYISKQEDVWLFDAGYCAMFVGGSRFFSRATGKYKTMDEVYSNSYNVMKELDEVNSQTFPICISDDKIKKEYTDADTKIVDKFVGI